MRNIRACREISPRMGNKAGNTRSFISRSAQRKRENKREREREIEVRWSFDARVSRAIRGEIRQIYSIGSASKGKERWYAAGGWKEVQDFIAPGAWWTRVRRHRLHAPSLLEVRRWSAYVSCRTVIDAG